MLNILSTKGMMIFQSYRIIYVMRLFCAFVLLWFFLISASYAQIRIPDNSGDLERYAASELQRYMYQLIQCYYPIVESGEACFVLDVDDKYSDRQGYSIKTIKDEKLVTLITGNSPIGLLYGVYGFLEDYMGIRFYMSGDVYPKKNSDFQSFVINETKCPKMQIRGILPWTNFPQSATIYSYKDWKFIIDQSARMRMNFIMFHNYNGMCGHNEAFQNFEYKGFMSRNWMPTIKSGHGWLCPGWDINNYQFGACEIYDDYDFGADYGIHNETLSNRQIADKGASMFRKIIKYAHTRGVKIGLGLDIDLIHQDYQSVGADAADPYVIKAQVENIANQYKDLDYVFCFQSESLKDSIFYKKWRKIFDEFYYTMKRLSPNTKIAVSGWGLTAESVRTLPEDVICAPISPYSASFESGEIYGDREYWGCPWLERDFNSSQYYYPYNINLSETIKSYSNRASNMNGLYALTWRLTDAISPKLWYISKAPWVDTDVFDSSRDVYWDFASMNYGEEAAEAVIDIINENEVCSSNFGECEQTPPFDYNYSGNTYYYMNIKSLSFHGDTILTIPAKDFVEIRGAQLCDDGDGKCVGNISRGSWIKYSNINFSNVKSLAIKVSSGSIGGKITVFIDNMNSIPIGSLITKGTGGWAVWVDKHMDIKEVKGIHDVYLCFSAFDNSNITIALAEKQLQTIEDAIRVNASDEYKLRLGFLKQRLSASLDHLILNKDYNTYNWNDFPGRLEPWAKSFLYRIDDISSKGNIMSVQNRFIQLNYINRINKIIAGQEVKSPSFVYAKGTLDGAIVTWRNNEPSARCFKIYRNGCLVGTVLSNKTSFVDNWNGHAEYRISSVSSDGIESLKSIPSFCEAGNADVEPPVILCISPQTSAMSGQPVSLEISLVDNRVGTVMSADVYYRKIGRNQDWNKIPFKRKARSSFTAQIPGKDVTSDGVEYYVIASDGTCLSRYPVSDCNRCMTISVTGTSSKFDIAVDAENPGDNSIVWEEVPGATIYQIYRSDNKHFTPDNSTFLTFVGANTTRFIDNGANFEGKCLKGNYYYKIVAVDKKDNMSRPSNVVKVLYE